MTNPNINYKTLPKRMQSLARDERGYPVPWFVDWLDGKPEFRAMDPSKLVRAVREKLCWVCGERLGVYLAFVAGPMCGINRTSSEPPSHVDCARWSAENCPFLSNPRMVRREDELVNNAAFAEQGAGHPITRNPGVAMVWITRGYEIYRDLKGLLLIQMGEPESVEWYREGRRATRGEVQASVDSGLPALELLAAKEAGGMEYLNRQFERFRKYLPE